MKIALFITTPLTEGGGAEKYFIELANNLSRLATVDVITLDHSFYRLFARSLHIVRLGNFFGQISKNKEKKKTIKKRIGNAKWKEVPFKLLEKTLQKYNVIYSKNELTEVCILKYFGYSNLPPVVIGIHTALYYPIANSLYAKLHNIIYGLLYGFLINGVSCIHANNQFTKNYVEYIWKKKSYFTPYPFDSKDFIQKAQKKQRLITFDKNKINIGFIGKLTEQKGSDDILWLINKLWEQPEITKKLHFYIIGIHDKKYAKKKILIKKQCHWLSIHSYIPHDDIPSILKEFDLILTPSHWEVFPYAVLEPQALGIPVVAFDIPGPQDIIIHNKTGMLVGTRKELLYTLIAFMEKRLQFNVNIIRKNISSSFNHKKIYNHLFDMLNNISKVKNY